MNNLVCVQDYENQACSILPKNALDYYRSGAGQQETLLDNRRAFTRYKIRPRCLRDVSKRDISTTVLGEKVSMPIGIAPTAMQRMAHPDGECANVRAAEASGTVFTLSTISTSSIEEVAQAAPNALKWFQLYIYKDREVTRGLVERAEKAGFKALVLTVDAPMFGVRLADIRNKFTLPPHLKMANFVGNKSTKINEASGGGSGINEYVNSLFDPSLQWKDIAWLKSITKLPIVIKGVLRRCDAIQGVKAGVSGIWVSNHGARQIDGTVASIDALPEIVKAVGDKVEVYFDGGIRDGSDVFKAVALGARMVFFGRPALWGLACGGQQGVENVLNILKKEFDQVLGISGCTSIEDIDASMVVHETYYSKL
ncbi:2-Hydroxyacid oxidase 1 [Aethina tumida]|uniref:2-Hydroxyacid oxidase 1 n=1 Tax=Aethina tumida TaxID=116153 RepID=UPI00096B66D3|nr:2-Hydroxyacid oxidase 1 [Aethina tumida]